MSRPQTARMLTLAVLGLSLALVLARKAGWELPSSVAAPFRPADPPRPAEPRDAIYKMLDAARQGDAAAYLSCYSGQMQAMLRQSAQQMRPGAFSEYLRNTNQQIKGIALSEPVALTQSEVRVRVEYVYQDRNEAQQMYLEKAGERWLIARVDAAERVKTLVPYGTPVR